MREASYPSTHISCLTKHLVQGETLNKSVINLTEYIYSGVGVTTQSHLL